jgi:cell wall-associated NlpC family hydrolase
VGELPPSAQSAESVTTLYQFQQARRPFPKVAEVRATRARIGLILVLMTSLGALLSLALFAALFTALSHDGTANCSQAQAAAGGGQAGGEVRLSTRSASVVGATEYGGPGDPSSGTVGASGVNLDADPDSFAELGGTSFQTATAMGGLPYGTPLRISLPTHPGDSVIAYKQDIGLGGGPVDGHPRVIDLWWQLAGRLGIPYEDGMWSGTVKIAPTPATGTASLLAGTPSVSDTSGNRTAAAVEDACASEAGGGGLSVATVAGPRARLLSDGQAVAPAGAPAAVKQIIAAGNQIVGKPYVYGGGHGLPLSLVAPGYDCSSSVAHLLWGGGLLGVDTDMTAAQFENWGLPGPGRWVTLYASGDHVFIYVAGLRWDTHNAAGPGDGSTGIGWHPLVRQADGFVARHPAGL